MEIVTMGIVMFIAAFLGGLVQSVTGFGAGVVMMMFIPEFLPITKAAAVSSCASFPLLIGMVYTYRKHIHFPYVYRPLIFYLAASTLAVKLVAGKDVQGIKTVFGIFLVILSIYFLFFSNRIKLEANWGTAGVCGAISGAASGLFGIGGPPMVLYFMALTGGEKLIYLGTIQTYFLITNTYTTGVRFVEGILTADLIPYIAFAMAGIYVGKILGTKIVSHINRELMQKLVYGFLAVSGVLNIVSSL